MTYSNLRLRLFFKPSPNLPFLRPSPAPEPFSTLTRRAFPTLHRHTPSLSPCPSKHRPFLSSPFSPSSRGHVFATTNLLHLTGEFEFGRDITIGAQDGKETLREARGEAESEGQGYLNCTLDIFESKPETLVELPTTEELGGYRNADLSFTSNPTI